MAENTAHPASGAYSRLTFAIPDAERRELEALAREQDRSVAQLCRKGVRMVLSAESADREPVAA